MTTNRPLQLLACGYDLLEAGRWHPEHGLLFSDMLRGGVYALPDGATEPAVLIPHRKGVGGLVSHADGGLVLAGRNVSHKQLDGTTRVLLETTPGEQFFNDLTADGRGRLFVGSVGTDPAPGGVRPDGRLHQIDLDGSAAVIAQDIGISNGLAADPSDSLLYHVDSGRRLVWRYALTAGPTERRVLFVDTSQYAGVPDGLAVAADGSVWVAMAGGGLVVGWTAGAARLAEIEVPFSMVTSVCFGGPDYDALYVLTGVNHEHPDPRGGSVYRTDAPTPGLPGPVARVRRA
ncbi:MAG: SMP-30/gluconolactonase/LRE family protein [Sporichthyaceae bacterium]